MKQCNQIEEVAPFSIQKEQFSELSKRINDIPIFVATDVTTVKQEYMLIEVHNQTKNAQERILSPKKLTTISLTTANHFSRSQFLKYTVSRKECDRATKRSSDTTDGYAETNSKHVELMKATWRKNMEQNIFPYTEHNKPSAILTLYLPENVK